MKISSPRGSIARAFLQGKILGGDVPRNSLSSEGFAPGQAIFFLEKFRHSKEYLAMVRYCYPLGCCEDKREFPLLPLNRLGQSLREKR